MDTAPLNRQQRRAQASRKAGRSRVTALPGSLSQSRSRSAARGPGTGIGAVSEADSDGGPSLADMAADIPPPASTLDDVPPAGSEPVFTGYRGKYGTLKTGIVSFYGMAGMAIARLDEFDGLVIASSAESCADAWIAWGKADPRVMRVLMVVFGSPAALVVAAHAPMVIGIIKHHNINPLAPIRLAGSAGRDTAGADTAPGSSTIPPLPYQPVGPSAPTDTTPAPMPPYSSDTTPLMVPDEGLPADVDVALRQLARQTGRPYAELRQEALVQLAQQEMAVVNGHQMQSPGTLGAPVARE